MTKATNTARSFDYAAAASIAQSYGDTEVKVDKAKTALDNATQRRTTAVVLFADTCRAAGFNSMDPLKAKGSHRAEFLDHLAASYLNKAEHKAYLSDMATSDRSSGKQVLSARGKANNKLTQFVTRLLKAAEPYLTETPQEIEAKKAAKKGANGNKIKPLDVYTIETLQAILKRIGTDARKTDPTATCHAKITSIIKATMKECEAAFKA